jgi:hypothetical protein
MINRGFISLHRRIFDNPISRKPNYLAVFLYLLLNANFKDCDYILNKKKTVIKRGCFVGSLKKISDYYKISTSFVSKIINYFEADNMIKTIRTNKYTIFEIVNYDKFQTIGEYNEPEKTKKDGKPLLNSNLQGTERQKVKTTRKQNKQKVKTKKDGEVLLIKGLQVPKTEMRKQKPENEKQKNNVYNNNNNYKNFVVLLYCKLLQVNPDSSHYGFIGRLIRRERDELTYLQRCILLCYVLKSLEEKFNIPKFKGALINTYNETSYSEIKNNINKKSETTFIYKHNNLPY